MSDSEDPLALIHAIENRNTLDEIRELIQSGIDVNKQNEYGATALIFAAKYGGENVMEMINLLIDAGSDVNMQTKTGRTALMFAAEYGGENAVEMINLLVNTGVDIDKQDKCGFTALIFATMHMGEHLEEVVRLLVAYGATLTRFHERNPDTTRSVIKYINGALNWTPLHRAADARDADAIIKCLSEGMQPDTVVESSHQDMRTALSIAESTSYPTAQPVCDRCIALLRPSLVKGGAPSDSLFGGGGGGGGGGAHTET